MCTQVSWHFAHRYHYKCAERHVRYAVSSSLVPVKCCHQSGCNQAVGLEEVKLLLGDIEAYDEACRKAFVRFINQHSNELQRCYSLQCKQVTDVSLHRRGVYAQQPKECSCLPGVYAQQPKEHALACLCQRRCSKLTLSGTMTTSLSVTTAWASSAAAAM